MRFATGIALAAGLGALGACAPISEEECRAGNWTALGLEDGKAGRPMSRLNEYNEICSGLGVVPNAQSYAAAREDGLRSFCTPQNAYSIGRKGRSVGNVCPAQIMPTLLAANARGQRYHYFEERIENAEDRIDTLQDRLYALAKLDTDAARAEMSSIRFDIWTKRREIDRLEWRQERVAYWP